MADSIQVIAAHRLGTLIRQALPKARVHDWWIVAEGLEASVPQFTTIKDDEFVELGMPFVHGYCIGIEDLPRTPAGTNLTFRDATTLNVWGMYEYRLGNNQKNAEHVFATNLKAIQDKVSHAPRLQIDGNPYGEGDPDILGHHQLGFNNITSLNFNTAKKKVFLARGTIVVDVIVNLTT